MSQRRTQRGRGRGELQQRYVPPQYPGESRSSNTSSPIRPIKEPRMEVSPQAAIEKRAAGIPGRKIAQDLCVVRTEAKDFRRESLALELQHNFQHQSLLPGRNRSNEGNLGRKVKLISNCYPINLPSGNIYHYDVVIERKSPRKRVEPKTEDTVDSLEENKYRRLNTKLNREIIHLMLQANENFCGMHAAYDGRNSLYTRHKLKGTEFPLKYEVQMTDQARMNPDDTRRVRADVYEISIKPVQKEGTVSCTINLDSIHALFRGEVNVVSEEAIMAMETILKHSSCLKYVPVGRSFFYPPDLDDVPPLGGGREIWFGFHQSVRLGQWKPTVNLDVTATTFYEKGPVLKFVASVLKTPVDRLRQKTQLSRAEWRQVNRELKGIRIETTHLKKFKRKYSIIRLTEDSADKLEFSLTSNGVERKMTVKEYFRSQYDRVLQFPQLPCLQVKPEYKKIYLPVEVCDIIEGQHCKKKLDERQNAEMIRVTARKPQDRFQEIKDIRSRIDFSRDPLVREFDISVDSRPLTAVGRVIESPTLKYRDEQFVKPRDGSWDLRGKKFFQSKEIRSWVLLCFAKEYVCNMGNLNRFSGLLCDIACNSGIKIGKPSLIRFADPERVNVPNLLRSVKEQYRADLAVIVLPRDCGNSLYGEVKQAAETALGLITQCVKDVNVVKKCSPSLMSNLCQKINAKLGGVNSYLSIDEKPAILKKPVIIIGADVNHSIDESPSIAAAVGSLDFHPSRYAVTIRAQQNCQKEKKKIETILELKSMVVDLLRAFYRHTAKKPEKIIFYRDGVSEGELAKVKDQELQSLREACRNLQTDYEPGITFIVVQKRHHVRFMPEDYRDGVGKMKNIAPGTIVDNTVVHPLKFDFFLCSHFGLQGTSRPAYYTVIEDDNKMTVDDVQKMTYYLCHTFARCTKSISIPVPVQYADLAAYRARRHLDSQLGGLSSSSDSSLSRATLQDTQNAIRVVDEMKNSMYFV